MGSSTPFIDEGDLFPPDVESGHYVDELLFNPEILPLDNDAPSDSDSDTEAVPFDVVDDPNPNEDIFTDFTSATVNNADGCFFSSSSSISKLRIREEKPSCINNDNPSQKTPETEEEKEEALKKSYQEYWCSRTAMTGFGNIPVCEEQPDNTIPSEAIPNSRRLPPIPDPSGFVTLLQCTPLNPWDELGCPPNYVFCCNAWLPSPPGPDGWGYWCWPSDRSRMFQGDPPSWSDILRSFELPTPPPPRLL